MRTILPLIAALGLILCFSCAGSESRGPIEPTPSEQHNPSVLTGSAPSSQAERYLWGLWKIIVPEDRRSVEVIPLRGGEMHLNVIGWLEKPGGDECFEIYDFEYTPPDELQLDLLVRHPIEGNLNLTAFDARAIFISGGDYSFPASGKKIAWGEGLPRVLYPDGYTSLFNPTEYPEESPGSSVLKYKEGKFATGDDLSATLNPFVAFEYSNTRRAFFPGDYSARTIFLRIPEGPLEFGYAVDASWLPMDEPVVDPILDFPPEANCPEPYQIDVELGTWLTAQAGSSVPVFVEVFDHQGLDTFTEVTIEAPGLFTGERVLAFAKVTGADSWMFAGTVVNEMGAGHGEYPVLVRAVSASEDPNLGIVDAWNVGWIRIKNGWAATWGGYTYDRGYAVDVDSEGNVFVGGFFSTYVDFDPGPGVEERDEEYGCGDAFLSKFNPSGEFQWVRTWEEDYYGDAMFSLDVDITGNIYVAGIEGYAGCVKKLDPSGEEIWSRAWGNYYFDVYYVDDQSVLFGRPYAIVTDGLGSVYVTGSFTGTADFDPGPGIDMHTSSHNTLDCFLSKFDSYGAWHWTRTWGDEGMDDAYDVVPDGQGNVFVTGTFAGAVDFDPSDATYELNSNGPGDAFLAKFDHNGSLHWAKNWGGPGYTDQIDRGCGIAMDASGDVFVCGCFEGIADLDPGPGVSEFAYKGVTDAFLSRFNPSGELIRVDVWGGIGEDIPNDVTVNADGSVCITGSFEYTVDFDPGPETVNLTSSGWGDVFVSRFSSDGGFLWANIWGDDWDRDVGASVATDGEGFAYVTGWFDGVPDFDPGPGTDEQYSNGVTDVFLSKFPPDGLW